MIKASDIVTALLLVIQEKGDCDVAITWDYYPHPLPKKRIFTILGVGFDEAHEGAGGASDPLVKIMIKP